MSKPASSSAIGRTLRVTGQVQGVGFRPFVHRLAAEMGLAGSVRNGPQGVTIRVEGQACELDRFEDRLRDEAPPLACVENVARTSESGACEPDGFRIEASDASGEERGRVTVDTAVCADCLSEMTDPADRRHRHGLVNCTNCGPRYTIVTDLPYDRPRTTMAGFSLCPDCRLEYEDTADRRFHAQPVCCPDCGPQVRLTGEGDPIRAAARLIDEGRVLGIKGLGGYHLAVDATNEAAVVRLRAAKGRDEKPFAVMVGDLEAARRTARLSPAAERLLASPVAPIVLAPAREGELAPAVSRGSHRVGLMIPYTPIQHLLFAERPGPLVMTSMNETDDPLVIDDEEALAKVPALCDAVVTHDRPIERAVDDSIFLDTVCGLVPLRRARGLVPSPIRLPVAAPRPGLAVGGDKKSVVAVVRGEEAVLGQHGGDLDWSLALRRFGETIADLTRLRDVDVSWIAADAHPDYRSRRYAARAAEAGGLDLVLVQHHHAHAASLLAEHGRTDRLVALACDGVGYGSDGTAWGGEILAADLEGFERLGRLRPLRLPGGDAAAKETGRCALSWIMDALGPDHPAAERAMADPDRRAAVAAMLESDTGCPPSSGTGRLFDAAAALLGVTDRNGYEAQSGILLEAAASRATERPCGDGLFDLTDDLELDHRPLLVRLVEGREARDDLAWLFHDALADGLARGATAAAERTGIGTVGLTGGVFSNELLTELVSTRLVAAGLEILRHRVVPPGDGGLALGQAAVAAATLSRGMD